MITFGGFILTDAGGFWLQQPVLPPYTIRLRFIEGYDLPVFEKGTAVQVSSSPNIWDLTYENADWSNILFDQGTLVEVIEANSAGVTNMSSMFEGCDRLTTVPLFDTSNVTLMSEMFDGCVHLTSVPMFDTSSVTDMSEMFRQCISITSVPLFDTSNVTNMNRMFWVCDQLKTIPLFDTSKVQYMDYTFEQCTLVESGALALYQQASSQAVPPVTHTGTFRGCGINSTTGREELMQIPNDWK